MRSLLTACTLLLIVIAAFAHEYFLLAYKYKVAKGDSLELHLFVADGFNIQLERPMQKAITRKFELISENGTTDLLSETNDAALPIVHRKADFEGLGLFHMERDYAKIELPTKKFLAYLKEDHLENIKGKVDLSMTVQKERYSRYIKCLVQSGQPKKDTLYKTITGQNFEIILLQNPYLLHKGDSLQAKILFMGKPLLNYIISARNRTGSEPSILQESRTNAKGICTFQLKRKGEWFIHATHMIVCADKAEADWESFWTSYSFEIE